MLTNEQTWSSIRTMIQSGGAVLVALGAADPEIVEKYLGLTAQAQIFVGAAANIGTTIYSLWIRRPAGLIASAAAALPGERDVIITSPEIADSVPSPKVIGQ